MYRIVIFQCDDPDQLMNQDHSSNQLYTPELDVKKMAISHSFFLSFSLSGLAQDCLNCSSWFKYKSTPFCSAQCSGTQVWHYLYLDNTVVGVYGALIIGCV